MACSRPRTLNFRLGRHMTKTGKRCHCRRNVRPRNFAGMWPILLALGGICPTHAHQPFSENEGHRPGKNSRQNVRDVVVAAINCGHAHRDEARKKYPEQLTAVAPGSEQRDEGPDDVTRRKRAAANPSPAFDEIDQARGWATHKWR